MALNPLSFELLILIGEEINPIFEFYLITYGDSADS